MKTARKIAAISAIALSALAFVAIESAPAAAASPSRSDSYCLTYERGVSVCQYTTFAQCEATASGIGGQCDLNYFRMADNPRTSRRRK